MKEEEAGLEKHPLSSQRPKEQCAYLEVVLDSMEVVHEELLTVGQQEGKQGQGTGDQQETLRQRGLVWEGGKHIQNDWDLESNRSKTPYR